MDARTRLVGLLQLTRPGNVVGGALLAAIGALVAGGQTMPRAAGVAIAATALGTAAGNALNDYFDRDIDAINRPERPIPAGRVAPLSAVALAAIALAVATAVTLAYLPLAAVAIAVMNLGLLSAYTTVFKGTPGLGNGVVAVLVASAFWFGAAAVGDLSAALAVGILAGVATFTREVIKDIEDVPGDRADGLRTLPIAVGPRGAWYVGGAALLVGAVSSPLPYLRGTFDGWYLVVVGPAVAVMAYGWLVGLERPRQGQRLLKVGMYVALAAFVAGRLHAVG